MVSIAKALLLAVLLLIIPLFFWNIALFSERLCENQKAELEQQLNKVTASYKDESLRLNKLLKEESIRKENEQRDKSICEKKLQAVLQSCEEEKEKRKEYIIFS